MTGVPIIYWAHSYRPEDADVNRHFGVLVEKAEQMILNFDPPSKSVSEAKLQQNRRSCDGMVVVLPWRPVAPSPYILFEIVLALRAKMPVVVFIDDRLASNVVPPRVLQQRYSHRTYFRQVREHVQALRVLKSYMGDPPPVRYQPNHGQRCCGIVGFTRMPASIRSALLDAVSMRGYRIVDFDRIRIANPLLLAQEEALAAVDVVVRLADSMSGISRFWAGAVSASATPAISITLDSEYSFSGEFPKEFQPRVVGVQEDSAVNVLTEELDLFEQNFLQAQDPGVIDRYVKMQLEAGFLRGRYEASTRQTFIGAIMGDQYNVSGQTGAVGPNAHVHDVSFNQVWNQLAPKIDLGLLAGELERLREAMNREAKEPDHFVSAGGVAAAEASARQKDGPKMVEYLKTGGKWALGIAEKIGVDLAKEALKAALGM